MSICLEEAPGTRLVRLVQYPCRPESARFPFPVEGRSSLTLSPVPRNHALNSLAISTRRNHLVLCPFRPAATGSKYHRIKAEPEAGVGTDLAHLEEVETAVAETETLEEVSSSHSHRLPHLCRKPRFPR